MATKSWYEKLHADKVVKKVLMDKDFAGIKSGETMLVATPLLVDKAIRKIRKGRSLTIPEFRDRLAKAHDCDKACPVSTSIFIRISAEAALDDWRAGKSVNKLTPFWRVVEPGSKIAKKLNIDSDFIQAQRQAEGISD